MDAANFRYAHPRGPIYGYFTEAGLSVLRLTQRGPRPERQPYLLHSAPNHLAGRRLAQLLDDYFAGARVSFEEVALDLSAGTVFQQAVWRGARETSWGMTETYGALAKRLGGGPGAAQAVGAALGANPVAILVPCHRFIAADGGLVNFAAGLPWKQELLSLEGAILC